MSIKISKYNASGNDFAIFEAKNLANRSELAKIICDRHAGIGADGLIVIIKNGENLKNQAQNFKIFGENFAQNFSQNSEILDFIWEFYNSDGSLANMCGNGSRAAAMFAYENKIANEKMKFLTGAAVIEAEICENAQNFAVVESLLSPFKKLGEKFSENDREWHFYDTGVPHLVTFTKNLDEFSVELARNLRQKYNANVNFASLQSGFGDEILKVRTFERGVENETQACGTGMAACFIAGVENLNFKTELKVMPKSGEILGLKFQNNRIFFKGKVSHTFNAEFL